ncbi:MAG TPA: hypothetical protein VGD75_08525 [Bradyrhizobium sp.]
MAGIAAPPVPLPFSGVLPEVAGAALKGVSLDAPVAVVSVEADAAGATCSGTAEGWPVCAVGGATAGTGAGASVAGLPVDVMTLAGV